METKAAEPGYREIVDATIFALEAVGNLLLASPLADPTKSQQARELIKKTDGRPASLLFEKEVMSKFLKDEQGFIVSEIQRALKMRRIGRFSFTFVSMREPTSTKRKNTDRSGMDYWVELGAHLVTHPEPETCSYNGGCYVIRQMVNVKYTVGNTADNAGGRVMMAWALRGEEQPRPDEKSKSIQMIANVAKTIQEFKNKNTDYFFLTFTHSGKQSRTLVAENCKAYSLLGLDPEGLAKQKALVFNAAQSFPHIQIHTGHAKQETLEDISLARLRLIKWWYENSFSSMAKKSRSLNDLGRALRSTKRLLEELWVD